MSIAERSLRAMKSRVPRGLSRLLGSSALTVCLLATAVLNCPQPDPVKKKHIEVPFVEQQRAQWCGAACVQMWGKYLYPDFQTAQSTIADYTGWYGADPAGIVNALSHFLSVTAFGTAYPPADDPYDMTLDEWQDLLMRAQGDLLNSSRPSIPIVYGSRQTKHAIIWTGWVWEETAQGPFIHNVTYNDPERGKDISPDTMAYYKGWVFEPMTYEGRDVYAVVMEWGGTRNQISRARDSVAEFVSRRGRFSGGPRYYDPRDYDRYPRRIR